MLESFRPRRFAWRWTGAGGYETTVEVTLRAKGRGTAVLVEEIGWPDTPNARPHVLTAAAAWGEAVTLLKFYVEHELRYQGVEPRPDPLPAWKGGMRAFLTKRWMVAHAFVGAAVVGLALLGVWQLHGLDTRRAFNRSLLARMTLPSQPIWTMLPLTGARFPPSDPTIRGVAYRRAEASGRYDLEHEVILRRRSVTGLVSNHVLTPLITPDGTGLIVDRGKVPAALDDPPVADARPPGAEIQVKGVLVPSERRGRFDELTARGGLIEEVTSVDLALLERHMPYRLYPMWLVLEQQAPGQTGDLPLTAPPPRPEDGLHLFYAIQLLAVSAATAPAWVWFLRGRARRARRALLKAP